MGALQRNLYVAGRIGLQPGVRSCFLRAQNRAPIGEDSPASGWHDICGLSTRMLEALLLGTDLLQSYRMAQTTEITLHLNEIKKDNTR